MDPLHPDILFSPVFPAPCEIEGSLLSTFDIDNSRFVHLNVLFRVQLFFSPFEFVSLL